jgi:flagellin
MTDSATVLGAANARISTQKEFITGLMSAISRGIGQLVDADMNEESTRLQALQVKQQLGVQALGIANSSSQTLLRLFG